MKRIATIVALLCALLFVGFFNTGCAAVERARQVYEERARDADEAYIAWKGAIERLDEAQDDFEAFKKDWDALDSRLADAEEQLKEAKKTGNPQMIAEAEAAVEEASNELRTLQDRAKLIIETVTEAAKDADEYEAAYKASEKLVKGAAEDLKEAESAEDYLGTVLGWLGLGMTTLLTGGAATGAVVNRRRKKEVAAVSNERDAARSALRTTFHSTKRILNNEDMERLKDAQSASMSEFEKEAARIARRFG